MRRNLAPLLGPSELRPGGHKVGLRGNNCCNFYYCVAGLIVEVFRMEALPRL